MAVAVSFTVEVDGATVSGVPARLEVAHLADHPAAVEALKGQLKPGYKTGVWCGAAGIGRCVWGC